MANTVSDFFWKRLSDWGVQRIFGYPGDGINGLIGALDQGTATDSNSSRCGMRRWPRSWPAAHAKFTGELGVCLATSGPGAIHLLNGLYDAQDRPPAGAGDRRPAGPRWRSAATTSRKSI